MCGSRALQIEHFKKSPCPNGSNFNIFLSPSIRLPNEKNTNIRNQFLYLCSHPPCIPENAPMIISFTVYHCFVLYITLRIIHSVSMMFAYTLQSTGNTIWKNSLWKMYFFSLMLQITIKINRIVYMIWSNYTY